MRRSLAEAFPCPACGCLKSRVLPRKPQIKPGHGYVRKRYRRCENVECRADYTTTERLDPPQAA